MAWMLPCYMLATVLTHWHRTHFVTGWREESRVVRRLVSCASRQQCLIHTPRQQRDAALPPTRPEQRWPRLTGEPP